MNWNPKKLNILFFAIFITFGFLALASQARADYEPQGIVESKNMLSGATVTAINGFQVTAVVPANTTVSIKFSQDKENYYNSAGVKEGWDNCANGLTNVNLTGLGWTGAILFYKIQLTTTDPAVTATVTDAQVDYDGTAVPPLSGNSYPTAGEVVSTDLLSGGVFDFDENSRFAYNITSLPIGTSVTAQFSQDGETWYGADGTLWGESTLTAGSHLDIPTSLDLSALNWENATSFYYKLNLYSPLDDNLTPVVADAGLIKPVHQVYYSVGQSVADLKTGAPSVTISGGAATFTVAQTGNIGVGDRVTYNTSQIAYISAKTNADGMHWSLVTATGGLPADITDSAVVSITREFTSLASAEAAASNPTHINNTDLVAADVVLNLPCYYDSGADTTAVTIDGYTTGANNYIKVYTPNNTATEVNNSQRHQGKWDDGKYKLELTGNLSYLQTSIKNVWIDGLQIKRITTQNYGTINTAIISAGNKVSNNIINVVDNYTNTNRGLNNVSLDGTPSYFWNNIIYGTNLDFGYTQAEAYGFLYNNTVIGASNSGYNSSWQLRMTVKNNIAQNCADGFFSTTAFGAGSDYNISDLTNDAPSPSYRTNLATDVIFVDATNKDFHLSPTDTAARNSGVDLSADANLPVTTDIDGATRTSVTAWDIGADETATQIFRSVGPSATGILESDTAHARNVTLTSGVATFSNALSDNIGVGDAVLIDTGGTNDAIDASDTLLFIHARTDSTHYTLKTHTGATPSDITINDTYQIYRAYTSLANAEAGTKNTSIPITFNGGNRDLIANNEQWNIACYANGTTADTAAMTVDGWTTGENNFIKIYTPVGLNEVGVSQRHDGVWNDYSYNISTVNNSPLVISDNHVYLDGLQVKLSSSGGGLIAIYMTTQTGNANILISNSIIAGEISGTSQPVGIDFHDGTYTARVYNNIIYDFRNDSQAFGRGINFSGTPNSIYLYNNTVYNCYSGIVKWPSGGVAINNIVQIANDGFFSSNPWDTGTDYNISDLAADAPGANSKNSTNVLFLDEAGNNFCLDSDDVAAKGSGLNLSTDANLSFFDDIRRQARPKFPDAWSIGACESQSAGKIKMENDIKMEGDLKFK